MEKFDDIKSRVLLDREDALGEAILEHRTEKKGPCYEYNSIGFCNIMDCLYCENCDFKISYPNGDKLFTNDDLDCISKKFLDEDHVIIFYDRVPSIHELYSYLFDANSQFKIVRLSDNYTMVDRVPVEGQVCLTRSFLIKTY